ncbi:MAG: class I SAM-dependent methyltransferase [Sporocytophaga sp.]|uniref:class I SAM-dependent methyltransferase n=1 Tax=Sporocytophaga sp. TaxID=2231183 RepID=UPI001B1C11BB|nr:class I SAM-dependent methyltransferase [Sporocytophaga sp.]MBO9701961.1 class I SAM-dependent methyltransferase [Sporocytophaga sp.]
MIRALRYNLPVKDEEFDKIYPLEIQAKSQKHWTPINVAKKAAEFLVTKPNIKILDIGSGVGKFCIVGAQTSSGVFYGVEQRKDLVDLSQKIIEEYNISNINIIHANITSIDFSKFDAFYFFNSFYENIEVDCKIDDRIKLSIQKYVQYKNYLQTQFSKMPLGTRIATYSGFDTEIPSCFTLIKAENNFSLKYWLKDKEETTIPIHL